MTKPHAANLRKGRVSLPGQIYLVTCVTQDRAPLFRDFASARQVVSALRHHQENGNAQTLAYVVMPDHLHWLLALGEKMPLPRLLASLKSYTARRIGSGGQAVWQEGYHDHALRRDEEIRETARYLVAATRRAGGETGGLSAMGRDVAVNGNRGLAVGSGKSRPCCGSGLQAAMGYWEIAVWRPLLQSRWLS